MRALMIASLFALGCSVSEPGHASDGGGGGAAPIPEMRGHPVRAPEPRPGLRCKAFEPENTCHSDRPIAVVCQDNEAPPECELHNLAPDYFCCPP
jgi:hypothetical protein